MPKLLSSLPVEAKVKDVSTTYNGKPIVFRVMEHNHEGDPEGSTTLVTEKIISFKSFDAKEAKNSNSSRRQYGNNRYLFANISQWLNSEKKAGEWYTPQHDTDAPPNEENVEKNKYENEDGFLVNFTTKFKEAILTVEKRVVKNRVTDGGGYEDIEQKIFLLSNTEVGLTDENNIAEGSIYSFFKNGRNLVIFPTQEALDNSEIYLSPGMPRIWLLRTPLSGNSWRTNVVYDDGKLNYADACSYITGIRPACVVSSSILVSDEPDTDGAYTIIWNASPIIITEVEDLGNINAPFEFQYTITDADNDVVTATVSLDSEVLQELDPVVLGQEYNVKISGIKVNSLAAGQHTFTISAQDSNGNESTKTVTFYKADTTVIISGEDTSIGNKWQRFDTAYQASDSGNKAIDITEYIDGKEVRKISGVQQGEDIIFDLSDFNLLEDEQEHTLTIKAVNSDGAEAYRYISFTKLYKELCFELKPMETEAPAGQVMLTIDYDRTGEPELKAEVTNCAYNAQVIWEDATEAFQNKKAYHFTNQEFDGEKYGVSVRVTVTKNSSTERVRVFTVRYSFN